MNFKRKINKALALLLSLSLAMSTNVPVSALANEAAAPERESAAAEIAYVKSGEEVIGIDLKGNSVIIEEAKDVSGNSVPGKFQLIHDMDMDGVADDNEEKLVIDGEAEFEEGLNVYGVYLAGYITENFCITMNSGVVGAIYGAYETSMLENNCSVDINMNGGTAEYVYGLHMDSDRSFYGGVNVIIADEATITGSAQMLSGRYAYASRYYMYNQGAMTVRDQFTMQEDLELSSLSIMGGTFVIPEGMTLKADEVDFGNYSDTLIVLKGALDVKELTGTGVGKLLMAGGSIPENYTYDYMYFPVNPTSNIKNPPFSASGSTSETYTEGDTTTVFLQVNSDASISSVKVGGYDCYYSVNGEEYAEAGNSFEVRTPEKGALNLDLLYVPKQISVENNFSAQKGVVGKTYTTENPLCDLSTYPITNDTTEEYGGEIKYAVKKATPLPEGLSLVKGKIVGTPAKTCEEGQKVTFAVTGRNGSTTNFDLTIKIVDTGYTKKDINDLYEAGVITYQSYKMDLGGTSVVLQAVYSGEEYYKIYLDDDRDGLPDNNSPLVINGDDEIRLGRIYGYSNTEKAYDGDIRITVKGGKLVEIYGINGDSANCENQTEKAPTVTVNGDVSIYAENVTMISTSSMMVGAKNGAAENVTVDIKGGSFTYTDVIGVEDYSKISGEVNCNYGGKATVKSDTSSNFATWGIAKNSSVEGSVNAVLGFEDNADYGFIVGIDRYWNRYYATSFTGVSDTAVGGDINYTINGRFTPAELTMVSGKTVGGDVNFECTTGALNCSAKYVTDAYLIKGTTVTGELHINSPEESSFNGDTWNLLSGNASVSDVYVNYPVSCTETVEIKTVAESGSTIRNSIFINNKGELTVRGNYAISEDASYKGLKVLENTKLTIEEGVKVDVTGSTFEIVSGSALTNKGELKLAGSSVGVVGTLDNKGTLSTATFKIAQTGVVINEEGAAWVLGGALTNSGKIVNYGALSQTYMNANDSHLKLGTVYTSGTMDLSEELGEYTEYSSTTYSTFNVKVNVNYPSHCLSSVTLSGERISSSGIAGDTNQYIKMDKYNESPFTITLGDQKLDDVVLEGVTYGPAATVATTSDNVTWNASLRYVYEPFDVTVSYAAKGDVPSITLEKSSDTVTGLAVDQVYTYEQPLYDLTNIAIAGDITAEDGKVMYFVREGNLPDGIQLKDGKLYGRLTTASDVAVAVDFDVQGLNLTKSGFTLTFDPIAKAVPQWEIPGALTATVGQTLEEVEVPTDARGTYNWPVYKDLSQTFTETGTVTERMYFQPNDIANYDWSAISGWDDYEDNIVNFDIDIVVEPTDIEVTAPTGLTAVYGQTFAEVEIPSDENGSFEWDTEHHAPTDFVGETGEHTCYVTYIPTSKNYKEKSGIEVTLTVNAATPDYNESLKEVELLCDETLGDVLLPDADGGRYQWVSSTSTEPVEGESYQMIYIPEDTTNYDWTTVTGWNKMRKGVVFSVVVKLEHAWGEGVVTKPATEKEEGVKTYECGLCDATRTEVIPKLPNSGESGGAGSVEPSTPPTGPSAPAEPPIPQPPKVGYTISDSSSKAVYKVSKQGKEVTFVKPKKKTYTKVTVPATITYEGVKYKVTAIANNACKSNSKLKTVKIGSNVKTIGSKAFYGCKKLTKVTIGSKVTTIGNSAFQNCTVLKSITIPSKVSKIGSKAFYGCKKLLKMTIKTTKLTQKKVGKNAFTKMGSSNYKKVVVKVPKKQKKAYTKWLKKRGLNKKAKIK